MSFLYGSMALIATVHCLSFLLPTTLGMSLPLMARAVVGDAQGAGPLLGLLYGLNTLGASVGALSPRGC